MKPDERQSLERVLESAAVVSWADLMDSAHAGLIHIEYGFATGGTLDYVKFWSSITRGHWLLACEYWMSTSTLHRAGVHFDNGFRSEGLAHILESVMRNQTAFSLAMNLGREGLLQVPTPTQEESRAATASVNEALDRLSSALAHPAVA